MTVTVPLNDGNAIPILGLGVYQANGREAYDAVRHALDVGYRHVDTAAMYGNEEQVGEAVRDSGLPREEVFVTTKVWNDDHGYERAIRACEVSLRRLALDHIDLYLVHWPVPGLRLDTWRALVDLRARGLVRSIGVSNYMVDHLDELAGASDVVPAVNQFELTPYNFQARRDVIARCVDDGIAVEGYSPVTRGRRLGDPSLRAIADAYDRTPAQVLIRWHVQHGFVVIPKSTNPGRIEENADVFDWELSEEDLARLDGFDEDLAVSWDPTGAP